jgi:hypothetical protein
MRYYDVGDVVLFGVDITHRATLVALDSIGFNKAAEKNCGGKMRGGAPEDKAIESAQSQKAALLHQIN